MSASLRISTERAWTSTSPVASLEFSVPARRWATAPRTSSTNSLRTRLATSVASFASASLMTIWVKP